jgi:hypothetical protein
MTEVQPASSTATRRGCANGRCSFVSNRSIVSPSSCQSLFASRGRLCLWNAAYNNARVTSHTSRRASHVKHVTPDTSAHKAHAPQPQLHSPAPKIPAQSMRGPLPPPPKNRSYSGQRPTCTPHPPRHPTGTFLGHDGCKNSSDTRHIKSDAVDHSMLLT